VSRLARAAIAVAAVLGVLVALAIVAVVTGVLHAYRAPSPSMEPTVHLGDHFLVGRMPFPFPGPHRGDIVVFHPPRGALDQQCGVVGSPSDGHPCAQATAGEAPVTFVKRIVGVPGDELFVRGNRVFVNGTALHEPYVKAGTPCGELCNLPKPIIVPRGGYYVLGDNRGESDDSRDWGPITRHSIIGRYLFSYL
jgi:signal peptidase I